MEFVCYTDWEQLPSGADALFAKCQKDSLFFSRPWFENLVVTSLEGDQAMLLACVVEGDSVLAILPLMTDKGDRYYSLSNRYSSLYSLLLADGAEQEILTCLARGLRRLPFHSLRLEPVADNDANIDSLQRAMESSGFECHRYFRFFNWAHRLQEKSYDEYMAARPARVRSTIARKHRKLEREHGCDIRLYTGGDLQQAVKDYQAVYRASWKGSEPIAGFIMGLVNTLSESGWLRLAVLYAAGQPAAAQLWFVVHGKAGIFRLAYDDAWRRYSPGSILTGYLMAYVIDTDKVHELDFLMGNDRYKQDWMSERRERWGMIFANRREPPPKGGIYLFVESLKGLLKRQNSCQGMTGG
uniref:Acetyltransferase (GNAT) domain-containing protein n=1 Tax=Candidatus Kentrum sp. FM TaxID=2126340 RepID=A0A450S7Y8_9GAMM|nr:MAG: Acetyltransferase (GNAT) domain-containing protein [Candidatus Kentron sp. FM]VFJ64606.1 MAG: Acetyltransferase (GNAT) domain-containing protein [Candidatus Kentron sp. FM]VFK19300.1 MAG: Acetyltransferase (GNAT) domain-containing protein [Candidatus Kentron sp. FM]